MKEYKVTVNVVEYGRVMYMQGDSKADVVRRVKAGEWPEEGSGDPTHYRTTIVSVEPQ
jgi:hypothetical protein